MRTLDRFVVLSAIGSLTVGVQAFEGPQPWVYPSTRTVEQTDDYHGTKVADPYRWMEEADGGPAWADLVKWIEAQNKLTFGYLEQIPERDSIRARLTKMWNFERYPQLPSKEGNRYFYTRNDGLQNQAVLYVTEALDGTPRPLLDPNTLRSDGTVALAGYDVTRDGKLMAYGIADAGSDWNTWKVRNVDTGEDLADEIRWVKFGGASWKKDAKGFFYSRFDEPKKGESLKGVSENQKIFYHALGDAQAKDTLVYARPDHPGWFLFGGVTDAGDYLVINTEPGDDVDNGIAYKDLTKPDAPVVELFNKFDAQYGVIANDGPVFYVLTNLDAPKFKLVAVDVRKPGTENWKVVIPESQNVLRGVSLVGERFFASYLRDATTQVSIHDLAGKHLKDVEFPGLCSATGFAGKREDTETFYNFSSYTVPGAVFRYDITSGKSELFKQPKVPFNGNDFETKQVFYKSKDGTKVPMFITHKKGIKLDGNNPTLLYGYGGFNLVETPGFSPANAVWLDMGGVYVVANLRGGGEYGEEWHQGGMRLKKQNVFDDFIGAAEWLIQNKYTTPKKLAIRGGSNGGLLVGACMTQRPELFGACLPAVGVMDMLRFHTFTAGPAWVGDYGSAKDAEQFKAIFAYSPYHNIKDGVCYPPTLVTTGDHDDRVHPSHSFKFAARMQVAQSKAPGCTNPILIRVETRAGHGAGKPTSMRIEEAADTWAFLVKTLDMKVAQ